MLFGKGPEVLKRDANPSNIINILYVTSAAAAEWNIWSNEAYIHTIKYVTSAGVR